MKYDATTYRLTDHSRVGTTAWIIGAIGLLGSAGASFSDSERFYHAYLTAFVFWVSLALAGLFFTMLHYLTASRWSVVVRRISESLMMQLPWLAVAFVPIMLGMHDLYHWSHEDAVASDHLLQGKSGYLNVGFFAGRTLLYFAIWSVLALALRRHSLRQDTQPELDHVAGLRRVSAGGMLLFAITITFASFDWLMTLDPHWYSTIFGVYFFGGLYLAGVSLITIVCALLRRCGVLSESITVEHYHDLGKLMFAFVVFWAYIGFSQYFLIWYGNIPEETVWFLSRWEGGWKTVSLIIVFGHFVIPFVVLIFQGIKRRPGLLGIAAAWILVMHWVDMYWLVYPNYSLQSTPLGWIELAPLMGLGGIFIGLFWRSFSGHPVVPVGDPWLQESVNFVNR